MTLHALDGYTEVNASGGSTSETLFRGQERHRAIVRLWRNDVSGLSKVECQGVLNESLAVAAIDTMDILQMAGNGRRLDRIATFFAYQDSVCGQIVEKLRRLDQSGYRHDVKVGVCERLKAEIIDNPKDSWRLFSS
jgi:hypothetical protein